MDLNTPIISKIIDNWIDEDIGRGDLTSSSITEENGNAYWIAKEGGIFCGVEIIKEIFKKIDLKKNTILMSIKNNDGERLLIDTIIKKCGLKQLENINIFLNERHLTNLSACLSNLNDTYEIIKNELPFDLLSIELRDGIQNLSKITGQELTEELLDNIFSKFCIGK